MLFESGLCVLYVSLVTVRTMTVFVVSSLGPTWSYAKSRQSGILRTLSHLGSRPKFVFALCFALCFTLLVQCTLLAWLYFASSKELLGPTIYYFLWAVEFWAEPWN